MPKGQRTITNGFGQRTFPGASEQSVSENEPKKQTLTKKYIIGSSYDVETIVRLDKEGAILVFEQKEAFIQLDDAVVANFSRENRLNYELAKEFHDAWRGDEHAKLVQEFQVNPAMMGSAMDKLRVEGPEDLTVRWVAPYKVEKYRGLGYKVLSADEVKTFLGATGGHHEVGRLGQTELVAMGIPKELYEKRQKAKVQENMEKAGMWKTAGLAEITQAGGQGFIESEKEVRQDWHELPNPNEE